MAESTGSGDSMGYRSNDGLLWFFVWNGLFAILQTPYAYRELIMDVGLSTVNARPPLIPVFHSAYSFIGNLINRTDVYICRDCTLCKRPLAVFPFPLRVRCWPKAAFFVAESNWVYCLNGWRCMFRIVCLG